MNWTIKFLIFLNAICFFLGRSEKLMLQQDFDSSVIKLLEKGDAEAMINGYKILKTQLRLNESTKVIHIVPENFDLKPEPEKLPTEKGNEGHYSKSLEVPSAENVKIIQNETESKVDEKENSNTTIVIKGRGQGPEIPPYLRCYKKLVSKH